MFSLLPWSVGAKNKKTIDHQKDMNEVEQSHKPSSTAHSVSTKMKRKRRESDGSVISSTACSPPKKRSEYMSHVEIQRRHGDYCVSPMESLSNGHGEAPTQVDHTVNSVAAMGSDLAGGNATQSDVPPKQSTIQNQQDAARVGQSNGSEVDGATRRTAMKEAIEQQFSLEILLKHNELRLIESELAKCQVALEQLRRCQIMPYPASSSHNSDMVHVSDGVGPTYNTSAGALAEYPAPWDVTNGPYSRHYAKWLIPDPIFDGGVVEIGRMSRPAGKKMPQRTTRGAKDNTAPAAKARSQRGSNGRLQSLPAGYPEPKEEKGPMIVKRSSDGRMVKLVCLDCRRENFNSAQGFINHCRIAHSRGFASHDAAALACGEEVEYNEAGGVVSDTVLGGAFAAGLVHPLIRSAHVAAVAPVSSNSKRKKSHSKSNSASHASDHAQNHAQQPSSGAVPIPNDPFADVTFVPSAVTPHLSALFARTGRGGDLNEIVTEATSRNDVEMDIDGSSGEEDEDYEMEDAPTEEGSRSTRGVIHGGRQPARATMSPAPLGLSPSSKGIDQPRRKLDYLSGVSAHDYASPYQPSGSTPNQQHPTNSTNAVLLSESSPLNLSPNPLESNPAPSLVSDDASDYEDPHSESDAPSSENGEEEEDRYLDIEVEDREEEVGGSNVDPELTTAAKAGRIPQPTRRRSVLRSAGALGEGRAHQGRRVSFRSPIREREIRSKKEG